MSLQRTSGIIALDDSHPVRSRNLTVIELLACARLCVKSTHTVSDFHPQNKLEEHFTNKKARHREIICTVQCFRAIKTAPRDTLYTCTDLPK